MFEARHLDHFQASLGCTNVDERLDLEPVPPLHRVARCGGTVAVEPERGEAGSPERVVAIAQVRVPRAGPYVGEPDEPAVSKAPKAGDVFTAATRKEPRPLGEVGSLQERVDVPRDLRGIGRTVGIEHNDDVATRLQKAALERIALAAPCLLDDADFGK